ncbi:DUF4401 domain-containing protein [Psychrobacter sp. I-STPA10]|uniref:DUF4401 domain-containing protein n=1 Tax=Psychrobacter sp. I-STPA10 TaxID=2585769 RepID=UPI001E51ADC4|nr:DUF4401 domain-containing protein [Psychrobacter sp. I-STPA10]
MINKSTLPNSKLSSSNRSNTQQPNTIQPQTTDSINSDTPWYISSLMALSGLISGIFLISIFSILFGGIFNSVAMLSSFALIMSGIGFGLFWLANTRLQAHSAHIFIQSLGFAIAMAGQIYSCLAVAESSFTKPQMALILLLIQSLLTLIMPNFLYRLISSLVGLGCVLFLLDYYQATQLSLALLALFCGVLSLQSDEFIGYLSIKYQDYAQRIIQPLTYACSLILLTFSAFFIVQDHSHYADYPLTHNLLRQGLLIIASLYATWLILRRYGIALRSQTTLLISAAVIIVGLLSLYVSGLLATSLVMVIAFANRQRVLLGLAIFALTSYIFWYYYQMDTTLLIKSASMFSVGIALLFLRWLLLKQSFIAFVSTHTQMQQIGEDKR